MIKKVVSFFDRHRFIFVLVILFLVSFIFIGVKIFTFLNHKFEALSCKDKIKETTCMVGNKEIFLEPEEEINKLFKEYDKEIKDLKEQYNLPEFNFYTAYYYYLVSKIDYQMYGRNESIMDYLYIYINTYNLEEFYQKNNVFYEIFYPYKII